MKKNLCLWIAMGGLTLAGCVNDEVAEVAKTDTPQAIAFNAPVMRGMTKAVAGEMETPYNTKENFSVYAYYAPNGSFDSDLAATPSTIQLYMNDVKTAYTEELNAWDPAAVTGGIAYYWPKNGKLTFAAYSPSDANGTITHAAATGFKFDGFTVAVNITEQYDLMWSELVKDKQASDMEKNQSNGNYNGITLTFKHALSSIVLKFKTVKDYSNDVTITVKKVTIKNAYNKGTFNEGLSDGKVQETPAAAWTPDETKTADYVVYSDETGTKLTNTLAEIVTQTGKGADAKNADIILLPQKLTHGDGEDAKYVCVEVEYTIQSSATGSEAIEQVSSINLGTENLTAWEIGKRYIYNISIELHKIYFDPHVEDWHNYAENGIDLGNI